MQKIITLANQKGGVGKTTIAIQTAASLTRRGLRVLAIDADEQRSLATWGAKRDQQGHPELFSIIEWRSPDLHEQAGRLFAEHRADIIIIDAPGIARTITPSAVAAADLVLIPVQPSPLDIWASGPVVELIKSYQSDAPDLRAAFVLNARLNARITRKVIEALNRLPFPTLTHSYARRVIYPDTVSAGLCVAEAEPGGSASAEVEAVTNEVLALVSAPHE